MLCETTGVTNWKRRSTVIAEGLAIGCLDHLPTLVAAGWHCVVLTENFLPTAEQLPHVDCVPLIDDGGNPRVRIIEALNAVAEASLLYPQVAVVCRLGESRSVAITCGYLVLGKSARTMPEALAAIQEIRPEANPSWRLFQDVRKGVKETQQFQD